MQGPEHSHHLCAEARERGSSAAQQLSPGVEGREGRVQEHVAGVLVPLGGGEQGGQVGVGGGVGGASYGGGGVGGGFGGDCEGAERGEEGAQSVELEAGGLEEVEVGVDCLHHHWSRQQAAGRHLRDLAVSITHYSNKLLQKLLKLTTPTNCSNP